MIPLLALGLLFYFLSIDIIKDKVGESTLEKLANVSKINDLKIERVLEDVKLYKSDVSINQVMQKDFVAYKYVDTIRVIEKLQRILETNSIVKSIIVTTGTNHFYRTGEYSDFDFDSVSNYLLNNSKVDKPAYVDLGLQERMNFLPSGRYVMTLAMSVENYTDMSHLGYIYIDLAPEILFDAIIQKEANSETFVLDKNNMVAASNSMLNGQTLKQQTISARISDKTEGYFTTKIDGKDSLVVFFTSSLTGWTYLEYYPLSVIGSEMAALRTILIISVFALLFIILGISEYISIYISKPINELTELMTQVENGDLDVRINVDRDDDIGRLTQGFNAMVLRIKALIQTIYQQERKKKEIEIEVLQAQINPHFLYNTLNSIKWMAIIHNVNSISDMTDSLIHLLKLTIGKYGSMIELQQEIIMLEKYVSILNVRYNNGICFEHDVAFDLKDSLIPRMLLQPLVENAIIHGIGASGTQGRITIECSTDKKDLIVVVNDNGKGIHKDCLDELNSGVPQSKKSLNNIGIHNIDERIKLYYGQQYGLTIVSVPDQGTKVTVKIPLIYKNSHEHLDLEE